MSISGKELKRQLLGDYIKTNHVINDTINMFIKDNKKYPKQIISTPQHKSALLMKMIFMSQRLNDIKRIRTET